MERKMERTAKAAHILLLPFPDHGHINPLLQFGKRLAFNGLRVTLLTTRHNLKTLNFEIKGVEIEPISDGFDHGGMAVAPNVTVYLERFKAEGSRSLVELVHTLGISASPLTCLIYDSYLCWGLDVAHLVGIQGAAFFTTSVTFCSLFCLASRGVVSLPDRAEAEPVSLPGLLPSLGYSDIQGFFAPEAYPADFEMAFNQYSNLQKADWIFGNMFKELEAENI